MKSAAGSEPTGPQTLAELLPAIALLFSRDKTRTALQNYKRMHPLRRTALMIADFLHTTIERVELSQILDIEDDFKAYLSVRGFTVTQIQQVNRRKSLIHYARELGWSHPRFAVEESWTPIMPLLHPCATAMAVARFAIAEGVFLKDFSESVLDRWMKAKEREGCLVRGCIERRQNFRAYLRSTGLAEHFPLIDTSTSKAPSIAVRLNAMELGFAARVKDMLCWVDSQVERGVLRVGRFRRRRILSQIEHLYGYAQSIKRMQAPFLLEDLLTKEFISEYAHWLYTVRGFKHKSVNEKLDAIHTVIRFHPDWKHKDMSWWDPVISEIPAEHRSYVDDRRRQRKAEYDDLVAGVEYLEQKRRSSPEMDPKTKARLAHDCLLMRFLVDLVWPPSCVRTCRVEGKHPNIWKGPVVHEPDFSVLPKTREALESNPDLELWQFDFPAAETPGVNRARGQFLDEIAAQLEDYVRHHRSNLGIRPETDTLFVNVQGKPLTTRTLNFLVQQLMREYLGKMVTPTSIRPSFKDYWFRHHPKDYEQLYTELAHILWQEEDSLRRESDPNYHGWK